MISSVMRIYTAATEFNILLNPNIYFKSWSKNEIKLDKDNLIAASRLFLVMWPSYGHCLARQMMSGLLFNRHENMDIIHGVSAWVSSNLLLIVVIEGIEHGLDFFFWPASQSCSEDSF